ncbi:hypothetical protein QM012_009327 [Aureobasidium pullulans]|uniref:BTB domain-containing protein n=1 Tax=Aureobasidium pullulans TaxID=5580 RepID=A0ABR0TGH9_AURPU
MVKRKRRDRDSEDEEIDKKKIKRGSIESNDYEFFHDKPETAKKDPPKILVCNGEQFNVFPQILEICSPSFSQRWTHVEHDNRTYVNLDELDIRGVQVFANWAMDHERPVLIAMNDNEGDILDDLIICYVTAHRLRAGLLCDLILLEACKIGKERELIVRHAQVTKAFAETKRQEDALRIFLAALVAYQRRNALNNPITGRDPRLDKQRVRFQNLPVDFQFDLMNELSRDSVAANPCDRPRRFLKVVAYHVRKKEEKRLATEKARLEARGSRESPLFLDEDEEE